MKLLTWNACRLLSTGADVATITDCKIPEGSGEFSVSGYNTFAPPPSLQKAKTRVLILVKSDLAVRANVKVIDDLMDMAVQSVWLHFSHHSIGSATQGATLGAFVLGGIYREWAPLLSRKESRLRLGSLLTQISKAAEHGSRVVIHGDFNIDLDRDEDKGYYMASLVRQLPSSRRRPKSGGRPPTSARIRRTTSRRRPKSSGRPPTSPWRRHTTRRRWSMSQRRWAKSCRRPP
jgi:hypothetical protein